MLLPALRIAPDSEGVAGGGGSAFDPPPDLGTILVVDDDPNIRELICSVLEDDGYTVSAAATGAEALALFDGDPGGVRAAVVDLLMPGISGEDVIRRLRMRRAGLPCVVVSGFAERELPADVVKSGPTRLLPKPFRLEELSAAVRGITSAAPPA